MTSATRVDYGVPEPLVSAPPAPSPGTRRWLSPMVTRRRAGGGAREQLQEEGGTTSRTLDYAPACFNFSNRAARGSLLSARTSAATLRSSSADHGCSAFTWITAALLSLVDPLCG